MSEFEVEYKMTQSKVSLIARTDILIFFRDPTTNDLSVGFSIIKRPDKFEINLDFVDRKITPGESFGTVLATLQSILKDPPDNLKSLLLKQNLGVLFITDHEEKTRQLLLKRTYQGNGYNKHLNDKVLADFLNKFESMTLTHEGFEDVKWPGPDNLTFTLEQELFPDPFFKVELSKIKHPNVDDFEPIQPYPRNVKRYSLSETQLNSKESGIPLTKEQKIDLEIYPPLEEFKHHMVEFPNLQGAIVYFSTLNVSTLTGGKSRKSRKSRKLSRHKKRKHYSKLSRIYIKPSKVSNLPPRV